MTTKSANDAVQVGINPTVIDKVPVRVEAILGIADVVVADLSKLQPGDTFTLDSRISDPVELRVNGSVIAFGELVTIDGFFGVRIGSIAK